MHKYSDELGAAFEALADPTRRGMLERLSSGPATVSELASPLAMSLPAVLQHLRVLEACGLVTTEKVGRARVARANPVALRSVEDWFARRREELSGQLDRLEEYLHTLQQGGSNGQ